MSRITTIPAVAALALLVSAGLAVPPAAAQSSDGGATLAARAESYSTADVQRALSRAGYNPGPVDGIMGSGTRSAIAAFQRDNDLTPTGAPNAAFYRAMERQGYLTARAEPSPSPAAPAPEGDAATVAETERRLAAAGYDPGPVDGSMDWRTRSALRAFQRDADLQVTGRIDSTTRAVLRARTPDVPAARTEVTPDTALVEDVQLALRQRGYEDLSVTGTLDAATRAAIRDTQRREGLPVTGRPTRDLLARIEVPDRPESLTATARSRSELVEQVERALADKGYATGPINGTVEPPTEEAIRAYQSRRGMVPTGEVTETLLADLRNSDVQAPPDQPQQAEDPAQRLFRMLGERALQELQQ